MKAKIRKRNITTKQGLVRAIKEEWANLEVGYAKIQAESCKERCEAVLANEGFHINLIAHFLLNYTFIIFIFRFK